MSLGVYPSQYIEKMISRGIIEHASVDNVQPATLDLSVSEEVYRLDGIVLPRPKQTIRDLIQEYGAEKTTLDEPLSCQNVYLIRLNERLNLPDHIYGYANNKSSTGRINLQCRLLLDGVPSFDTVPAQYQGSLWIIVTPQSFNVQLYPKSRLNQVRFVNTETSISARDLKTLAKETPLLYTPHGEEIPCEKEHISKRNGLVATINLDLETIGYKCTPSKDRTLDYQRFDHDPNDFFEPIQRDSNNKLVLKRGEFYILSTYEYIRVPNNFSMEMTAYDPAQGEFRSHYAGFFDPGFGYGNGKLKGSPVVLEVIPQDSDFVVYHKQPICSIQTERLIALPSLVYGSDEAGSHYQHQRGPRLSKHFNI